jgi:cytochrome c biogenesis protein CcmG, thiol:disulfide interchange protein DsbE
VAADPDTPQLPRRASRLPLAVGLVLVAAFVALLGYGLVANSPSTSIDSQLSKSKAVKPPAFELKVLQPGVLGQLRPRLNRALSDGRLALSELRGLPVVLNYWASWCPPCRSEAPLLERTWLGARRQGVLFVGLNMQDLTGDARDFMRHFGISYTNIRDPVDDVARKWGVTGLPETFFLNRAGRVVDHVIGSISSAQLSAGIRAARSGRPAGVRSGGARRPTR